MSPNYRIILLSTAVFCLGFSCADVETYRIESTDAEKIVDAVGLWPRATGYSKIECEKYFGSWVLEDSCHEVGQPDRVPRYLVYAENGEYGRSVNVNISFGGVNESDRSAMLDSLGESLVAAFERNSVTLKE